MKNKFIIILVIFLASCLPEKAPDTEQPVEQPKKTKTTVVLTDVPNFNAQQAYQYIEKQVAFGPRVPGTEPHKKCASFLAKELASLGFDTIVQRTDVTVYTGKQVPIQNIIGQYNLQAPTRIMLSAHWDTRPFADRDTEKRAKPIDGANDGASGVGVLLEIARAISQAGKKPNIGFDIIFFDAEDYGQPSESMHQHQGNTWCLGSQYWARNLHVPNYSPKYGILLDMVGAKNAVFPKEGLSMYYAAQYTNNIWAIARELGYSNFFIDREIPGGLTDDHKYVNEIAKIPCLDIIHYEPNRNDFGAFHHTHKDNMSIIDTTTLKAVGETILQVLYQES